MGTGKRGRQDCGGDRMLKLIPYTKQLVSIGNQNHYDGQLVWSDGKVAYGWDYAPQHSTQPVPDSGGLYCGIDSQLIMRLSKRNLMIAEHNNVKYRGEIWCYPAWATLEYEQYHECGYIHLQQGCYKYSGAIVSLGADGTALVYYDYKLHFMQFGSRKVDSSDRPLNMANIFVYGDTVSYTGNYYSKDNQGVMYVYDDSMTLLCTYADGHVHSGDYDGDGTISINTDFPIFNSNDTIVDLADMRSLSGLNPIFVVDKFRPNGPSGTEPVIYNLLDNTGTADVRKMFQLSNTHECYITANSPDRDQDGDVYYNGDYTLHCDVVVASGSSSYITKVGNTVTVYENSRIHAYSDGSTLAVYDSQGTLVYSGQGWIDTYNLTDTGSTDSGGNIIYSGDYIALKPLSVSTSIGGTGEATINGNDVTVYDDVTGDVLAETDGTTVTVYEDGAEIYDSIGDISTTMQPCEWDCDYTIRRDIRGSNERIVSIGGTVTHDDEGWHIDGGTIELRDISTNTLYADGTGGTTGGGTTGTVNIYDAQGQVEWTGDGWIDTSNLNPMGQDQQGNYLFNGSFTIRRDVTGSGIVRGSSGSYTLYDSNHDLVATERSGTVTIYTASGQIDWQGSGWIDVDNLVPVRYAGSYLVNAMVDGMTGSETIITKNGDIYVLQSNRQDVIANEDGSGMVVYSNGSEIYDGPGHITTANMDTQRSIKSYYIDATGIVEQQYPQTYQLAQDVSLNLSTMDVTIDGTTYGNDALELLTTQGIIYPAGVHVWKKKFFLSQDTAKIYKAVENAMESKAVATINNCFNLVWLKHW